MQTSNTSPNTAKASPDSELEVGQRTMNTQLLIGPLNQIPAERQYAYCRTFRFFRLIVHGGVIPHSAADPSSV